METEWLLLKVRYPYYVMTYEGVSKSSRTESVRKYTLTFGISR